MITFGHYKPDASKFDTGTLPYMRNAQPVASGWAPFPSLVAYSSALPDQCRGAVMAGKKDGSYLVFAGTLTNLYKLDPSSRAFTSLGAGYHLSSGDTWSFVQYGTYLIAANQNDNIQFIDIETGTAFGDLVSLKGRSVAVIGSNLFLGSLLDAPDSVQWSATEDADSWDITEKGADIQALPDGGWVQALFSGERGGYVFQKHAIRMITWQPGQTFNFRFDKISDLGLVGRDAATKVKQTVYFLSSDGFYAMTNGQVAPIGAEVVDRTFTETADLDRLDEVMCISDPLNKVVYWAFASSSYTGDGFDRIWGYDYQLGRWFNVETDVEWLASAATPGHSLESLDSISASIDALAASLDSPAWTGGKPVFAAFNTDHELCFAHGPAMDALFETADIELYTGKRALMTSAALVTDCATPTLQVGTKETRSSAVVWKDAVGPQASGRFPLRANGKLHRLRANLSGEWSDIHGIDDIEAVEAGIR